jgi:hypothetical protein
LRNYWLIFILAAACGKVVGDLPGGADASSKADARPPADASLGPDGPPPQLTVRMLRMQPPPAGTQVMLKNVIVVGHATRGLNGLIYVQDMGNSGGGYNGILAFCGLGDQSNCNLTRNQVDALPLGQVVDVSGAYDVASPGTGGVPEPRINKLTITSKPGQVVAPAVFAVDPANLTRDKAGAPATQQYLQTYVKIQTSTTITDTMPADLVVPCLGQPDGGTLMGNRGVYAMAGSNPLAIVLFVPEVTYCVPQCGQTCNTTMMMNDTITQLQGIVSIVYKDNGNGTFTPILSIAPTQNSDLGK